MNLNPTLWRTCRILSGPTRLKLLRLVLESNEWTVTRLADAVGIGEARASQELRRLQSRGLIRAVRAGRFVRYQAIPDPQVASAKPLLLAMKAALAQPVAGVEEASIRVAKAYAHPRRLRIVRALLNGPRSAVELCALTGIPEMALFRHLRILKQGGVVQHPQRKWEVSPNPHPLAVCMLGLLEAGQGEELV